MTKPTKHISEICFFTKILSEKHDAETRWPQVLIRKTRIRDTATDKVRSFNAR